MQLFLLPGLPADATTLGTTGLPNPTAPRDEPMDCSVPAAQFAPMVFAWAVYGASNGEDEARATVSQPAGLVGARIGDSSSGASHC